MLSSYDRMILATMRAEIFKARLKAERLHKVYNRLGLVKDIYFALRDVAEMAERLALKEDEIGSDETTPDVQAELWPPADPLVGSHTGRHGGSDR